MDAQDEESQVEFLTTMMGNIDSEMARRVLRQHKGSVESAAQSLLEGNIDLATTSSFNTLVQPEAKTPPRKLLSVARTVISSRTT